MIVAADCPSREQLRQYTLGTLREDSVPGLETHLETCRVCSDTVQQLESQGDSFLDMLNCWKEFPGFELLNEQPFLSAVDHLSQMKIEHSAAAFERMQHSQVLSILDQFPKPGQRLGQYLLLEVAGRGGMGLVYRALHLNLRTTVAVKFLQSSGIDSSQSLDRFRREMQAVGQIVHPNVVRALDAGEAEGIHFLVMEFVDGQDLSAMLKQHGRISTGHACEMIRMAARGLQEIHEAGMVHRDLKPGNLMLSRDGQVRILDLGLALLNPHLSTVGDDLTTTGQLMGTIDYMAPEQADDTHGVDFRADIYGLGATLFALVTGKPPFGGQKKSLLQKLSLLATQSAPLMQNVCPEVSPGLCDIVARMLARDPQQRFASAREVAEALEPYCDSGGLTELLPAAGFPGSGITEQDFTEGTTDASQNTIIVVRSENPLQLSGQNTASIAGTHHGKTSRIRRILNWTGMGLAVVGLSGIAAMLLVNRPLRDISADTASQGLRDVPFITEETPGPNEGRRNSFPDMSIDVAEAERVLSRLASGLRAGLSPSQSAPEWDVFSSSTFPDVRADAIHLAHRYLPVTSVLAHLRDKANPSVRAGLLLALSEYEPGQVMQAVDDLYGDTATFLDSLFYAYVNENDVEVHSCLEFLLRTWGHDKQLEKLRPLLEQKLIPFEGGWFRPLHCSTMVVIPGPRTETPGFADTSTDTRTSAERSGATREVTIPYSFAISTTEVTQAQLRRVAQRFWEKPLPANPNTPANNVYWSQAAEFCNWLTILDGMPVSEQCYIEVQTEQGPKWRQKPEALELSGYRLPTDDEWEIACRAGSKTSRPFGESTRWLDKYVVSSQTSENPVTVSTRKPNAWGLFDMLGNVSEWIQTSSAEAGLLKGKRRIRGGSIWTPVESLTADAQFTGDGQDTSPKMGFRVARTLVKTLQDDAARDDDVGRLQLYVGPPACPDELKKYVDPRFQHMKWKQVVRVGNWNVHTPVCRTFQFRNVSTDPIAFPELHGLNGHYAFDPEPSLLIEPNSITEFGLRMLPLGTVGERSQHFHFRWGDRKGYDFEPFLVHGCFSGPLLEVLNVGTFGQTPAALDMGIVPINSKVGTSAYVRNVGSEPVFAEVTNVSGPFRLTGQLAGEIFPHRLDHAFQVVLNADVTGPAEGQITIRTTEANPSELTFPVRAVVADSREFSSLAIFRKGTWLIDHNRDAVPDEIIPFGDDGDSPITGDWNGDGVSDLGVWQTNPNGITKVRLQLRGDASESTLVKKSFLITDKLKQILAADRDGDGVSEIGYIVPHPNGIDLNWAFGLQSNGLFSEQFSFGRAADDPVIGDWNGDGKDDIAVARPGSIVAPGNRQWELMWSDLEFPRELIYLSPYDLPVGGDWDGDGDDEPGGWKPLPPSNSSVWQFETDGDSNSNHELIGFGADPQTDKPAVLRSRRKVRQDL